MSMFLQENMGVVPLEDDDDDELSSDGDNEALDEDGILSGVKKFLNAVHPPKLSLTEQLNKATTKAEVQKVIDKIERGLAYTEKWLKDSALADSIKGAIVDSEDDKKKIKQERNLLKSLKSRAQGKLRSLRN